MPKVFVNDDNSAFDVLCAASTFAIVCGGKEKPITTLLPHNSHENGDDDDEDGDDDDEYHADDDENYDVAIHI